MENYKILGLTRDATQEEIREAYFSAARNLHPDTNPDPKARELFLKVQEAYEVLSSPDRRIDYDKNLPPVPQESPLNILTKYSRKALIKSNEPQLFYALLDISTAAEPDKSHLPPVYICLVVDRSTSMQGERMDMIKSSAAQLIKQLRPQDWISVVTFSDRPEVLIPPTRASEVNKFEGRISLIKTGGSTELMRGLQAGYEQLVSFRGLRTLKHLVLLTDGHTYGDEEGCLALAERAVNDGITIFALGIGHEWNDAFLDKLATNGGGNALFIKNAGELSSFFDKKITAFNMVYAKGLRLNFILHPQVTLRYAFRIQPDCSPLSGQNNFILGDLNYKSHLLVMFELLIKDLPQDISDLELFKGKLWMDIVDRTESRSRLFLDLPVPVQANPPVESPPEAILEAMSQISLYRLQEKARVEVSEGKIEQATRHLQYLATNMLSMGNRKIAHEILMEAEHVQQNHTFSSDGDKRIKYGTRALLLPSGLEERK